MISGSTIMVVGAVQASFFITLLAAKKQKSQSDFLLISYFLIMALHLAYYYGAFYPSKRLSTEVGTLGFSLVILHTPLFFLYVRSLVLKERIRFSMVLMHTLPYVVYNILILGSYYLGFVKLDPQYGYLGITEVRYSIFFLHGEIMALITIAYILWGFRLLRIHKRRLLESVSSLEHAKWLRFLVLSFLFYFVTIYVSIALANSSLDVIPWNATFYVISFILMAFIFVIGYFGLRQSSVFIQLPKTESSSTVSKKYAKSGLDSVTLKQIETELDEKMKSGKHYLDTDLTLATLASLLGQSPTYLSQVINQSFGVNFYDFVNQYRVDEAKAMLLSPKNSHLSFLGIAMECGFKSKSTFNKFFKKYAGMTPSEFKAQQAEPALTTKS